jgi:hypothetical protein
MIYAPPGFSYALSCVHGPPESSGECPACTLRGLRAEVERLRGALRFCIKECGCDGYCEACVSARAALEESK